MQHGSSCACTISVPVGTVWHSLETSSIVLVILITLSIPWTTYTQQKHVTHPDKETHVQSSVGLHMPGWTGGSGLDVTSAGCVGQEACL
jgi:hypothetical protein